MVVTINGKRFQVPNEIAQDHELLQEYIDELLPIDEDRDCDLAAMDQAVKEYEDSRWG